MINNFGIRNLRNAEYCQFMVSVFDLFTQCDFVRGNFEYLYESMGESLRAAETALAAERKNEKVKEKNEADRYRDRLHSKLFNYLKAVLYFPFKGKRFTSIFRRSPSGGIALQAYFVLPLQGETLCKHISSFPFKGNRFASIFHCSPSRGNALQTYFVFPL